MTLVGTLLSLPAILVVFLRRPKFPGITVLSLQVYYTDIKTPLRILYIDLGSSLERFHLELVG